MSGSATTRAKDAVARLILIIRDWLAGRLRFSDWGQVSGQVGLELQKIAGRRKRTEPTFDATLTLMPSDDLRFDFTGARRTLDNVLSIERRITAAYASGSVDYWPTPLLRMTVRAEYGDYSDGNRRRWGQVELERRLRRDPNIFIGARATSFGFSKRLENGYFNPDSFRSAELTARVWHRIGKRSWLDVGAALGVENADPGGSQLAYSGKAKLTHGLSDQVEVSLTADAFSSRTRSDSGFSRQTLTAAIGLRW